MTTFRSPRPTPRSVNRRGITLVEMLIAMVLTLMVMGAVVTVFEWLGTAVAGSRATLEMTDRLRLTRDTLQNDLENLTCPTLPWTRRESMVGCFELVEGVRSGSGSWKFRDVTDLKPTNLKVKFYKDGNGDLYPENDASVVDFRALGDFDDILVFTVKSRGEPFIGRIPTGTSRTVVSDTAEVVWYAIENPLDGSRGEPGLRTIYRRVRLVAPWLSSGQVANARDISVGATGAANTLGDLSLRENRLHHKGNFPFPLNINDLQADTDTERDTILTNVLAFDVRVYDPKARLRYSPNQKIRHATPDDPEWYAASSFTEFSEGAYVDLGYYARANPGDSNEDTYPGYSVFSSVPHPFSDPKSKSSGSINENVFWKNPGKNYAYPFTVYDTWCNSYEVDGIDQDDGGAGVIDEGTDGFDTDLVNGVDDIRERETSPPYPVPLRGIKVMIRVYEPGSRQIRQVTIIQNFAAR